MFILVLVQCNGSLLLDSRLSSLLMRTIQISIEQCHSWRGYKWAGRLIRETIHSLAGVYLTEFGMFDMNPDPSKLSCSHVSLDHAVASSLG